MPVVRLELHRCFLARVRLWLLLQSIVLPLLLFGGLSRALVAAAMLLPAADLLRARWRLPAGDIRFDGGHWWLVTAGRDGEPLRLEAPPYCSPLLLSARLRGAGDVQRLLLWRGQVGAETWRRLCLALRYGVSTVSTASGASSG